VKAALVKVFEAQHVESDREARVKINEFVTTRPSPTSDHREANNSHGPAEKDKAVKAAPGRAEGNCFAPAGTGTHQPRSPALDW
jgi:hypothetical protein